MTSLLIGDEVVPTFAAMTNQGANANVAPIFNPALVGNHNNYYPNKQSFHIMGRCNDVDNALRSLWNGPTALYVPPATPMQMQIVSTSANDSAAGTGIRTMTISYLDNDWRPQSLTVLMNGLTPVLTSATNIRRINAMHALTVGSAGAAVGNISLSNAGVTYSYIEIGQNLARQAVFTVPDGFYGYLYRWDTSTGSMSGNHFTQTVLLSNSHEGILIPGAFLPIDECGTTDNSIEYHFACPIVLPPRGDVGMVAISDGGSANVVAMGKFSGWLEAIPPA